MKETAAAAAVPLSWQFVWRLRRRLVLTPAQAAALEPQLADSQQGLVACKCRLSIEMQHLHNLRCGQDVAAQVLGRTASLQPS